MEDKVIFPINNRRYISAIRNIGMMHAVIEFILHDATKQELKNLKDFCEQELKKIEADRDANTQGNKIY